VRANTVRRVIVYILFLFLGSGFDSYLSCWCFSCCDAGTFSLSPLTERSRLRSYRCSSSQWHADTAQFISLCPMDSFSLGGKCVDASVSDPKGQSLERLSPVQPFSQDLALCDPVKADLYELCTSWRARLLRERRYDESVAWGVLFLRYAAAVPPWSTATSSQASSINRKKQNGVALFSQNWFG